MPTPAEKTDKELLELAFRAMDTFGSLEGTWYESEWTSEHFGAMTEEERDALLAAFGEWSDRTQGEES